MTLLTLFTAPKPFTDPHINTIQRNALQSWLKLGDEVEVLVIGDEPGLGEAIADIGGRQLADVARNDWDTPLISSIFSLARQHSRSPYLCYVNADILFLPDLIASTRTISQAERDFLVIGQRWDLDVKHPIDFSNGWEDRLQQLVKDHGSLHPPAGSDYFIFPRDSFQDIPDFAVGRAGWDNWMISHAIKKIWAVIDATESITTIHQDHLYDHLPGGKPHYGIEESDENRQLAGGKANMGLITDANRRLVDGRLETVRPGFVGLVRRAELWLTPAEVRPDGMRWALARRLKRLRRRYTNRRL
jgi:hypothetical protein